MEWGWSADAHFPALVRPSVVDAHAPHQPRGRYQPTDAAHAHHQGMPHQQGMPLQQRCGYHMVAIAEVDDDATRR